MFLFAIQLFAFCRINEGEEEIYEYQWEKLVNFVNRKLLKDF